jgi:hypothetical protein
MSVITNIAEALKHELNAHDFSMEFEAARDYLPVFDLQDMQTLHVTVVPAGVTIQKLDRSRTQSDVQVDIGVQKKLSEADNAEIDTLMALVEEIVDFLQFRPLAGLPTALWVSTENNPIFVREHMSEMRQFTSVLTLNYRVAR